VKIAATPGIAAAALMSMALMIACACGERRNTPIAMSGRLMSAT
jgi:hypothetical protein